MSTLKNAAVSAEAARDHIHMARKHCQTLFEMSEHIPANVLDAIDAIDAELFKAWDEAERARHIVLLANHLTSIQLKEIPDA